MLIPSVMEQQEGLEEHQGNSQQSGNAAEPHFGFILTVKPGGGQLMYCRR
jgi:hypothetical protein